MWLYAAISAVFAFGLFVGTKIKADAVSDVTKERLYCIEETGNHIEKTFDYIERIYVIGWSSDHQAQQAVKRMVQQAINRGFDLAKVVTELSTGLREDCAVLAVE